MITLLSIVARGKHLEAQRLEDSSLICSRVPLSYMYWDSKYIPSLPGC